MQAGLARVNAISRVVALSARDAGTTAAGMRFTVCHGAIHASNSLWSNYRDNAFAHQEDS